MGDPIYMFFQFNVGAPNLLPIVHVYKFIYDQL